MQAAMYLAPASPLTVLTVANSTTLPQPGGMSIFIPSLKTSLFRPKIKLIAPAAVAPQDNPTVDYNTVTSVFPAEACEIIGGEACDVQMNPEVKLTPDSNITQARIGSETVDREYLDYNSSKTVFPGEACDDLGGEFCEPEYQSGVY